MQRSRDKSGFADQRLPLNWTMTTILTVHAVIFLTPVGLAVGYPGASEWISAAVQAEFVDAGQPSVVAKQTEQSSARMAAARAN
jgi:hypothetical protein